jgi:CBS domain-containing protein
MKIGQILHQKNHELFKVKTNDCIADAAVALSDNKIGALLVEDDAGKIVGILSERDIVGGIGPHGADLQDVAVSELMTSKLIHCSPDDSVNEALAMMSDRRIRHLPVFDGDSLIGFISIGDLVKCRIIEVQAEAEAMRQYINS